MSPRLWSVVVIGAALMAVLWVVLLGHKMQFSSDMKKTTTVKAIEGLDFWWMANLRNTPLQLSRDLSHKPRTLVFPESTKRIWVDVGVNTRSDFIVNLEEPQNADLFLLGFEPSSVYKPCDHARCVVFWAACTPDYDLIDVNVQGGGDLCNSLLKPDTNTASSLWRGCVTQEVDSVTGKPKQVQAPGIPLHALVSRIPQGIEIEYIKIDAQGFDLEVMKGALSATERLEVVSLEAMDVKDRSKLLYLGQPTLDDIKVVLQQAGWIFIKAVGNDGVQGEVNAFFVSDRRFEHKVEHLAAVLMSNKEGRGQGL